MNFNEANHMTTDEEVKGILECLATSEMISAKWKSLYEQAIEQNSKLEKLCNDLVDQVSKDNALIDRAMALVKTSAEPKIPELSMLYG